MRYLTLGFSVAFFIAAGVMALAMPSNAGSVMRSANPASAQCEFTSNQGC